MEGAVIDPGDNAPAILQAAKEHGVRITWVLLTHGHFDHILAVPQVLKETGAKLAIHKDDLWMLTPEALASSMRSFGLPRGAYEGLKPDILAEEGTEIQIGSLTAVYLHTPGHTPGSSCIRVGDVLFTGIPCSATSAGGATSRAAIFPRCCSRSRACMICRETSMCCPATKAPRRWRKSAA